jgi:hypothetical protein
MRHQGIREFFTERRCIDSPGLLRDLSTSLLFARDAGTTVSRRDMRAGKEISRDPINLSARRRRE